MAQTSPFVAAHLGLTLADAVLQAIFTVEDPGGWTLEWVRIHLHSGEDTPEESMDLHTGALHAAEPL